MLFLPPPRLAAAEHTRGANTPNTFFSLVGSWKFTASVSQRGGHGFGRAAWGGEGCLFATYRVGFGQAPQTPSGQGGQRSNPGSEG